MQTKATNREQVLKRTHEASGLSLEGSQNADHDTGIFVCRHLRNRNHYSLLAKAEKWELPAAQECHALFEHFGLEGAW